MKKPLYTFAHNPYSNRTELRVRVDDNNEVLIDNDWLLGEAQKVHNGIVRKRCMRCELPVECQCGPEKLEAELELLKEEIEVLRFFGNKDCTAQADEHLGVTRKPLEE